MAHRLYGQVAQRAMGRCEYCLAPERVFNTQFEVEHIHPSSRGGADELENLALSCRLCNGAKLTAVQALDPVDGSLAALFDPRRHTWNEHFQINIKTAEIIGRTPTGRATVQRLRMNKPHALKARQLWILKQLYGDP